MKNNMGPDPPATLLKIIMYVNEIARENMRALQERHCDKKRLLIVR
jgi:hypothetical protein